MSIAPVRQLIEQATRMAQPSMLLAQGVHGITVSLNLQAGEVLPADSLVNLHTTGTSTLMRLADASHPDRRAHGFASSEVAAGAEATFIESGINPAASSTQCLAELWLSDTVLGGFTTSPPSTEGHVVQRAGVATIKGGMIVDLDHATQL